MKSYLLLASGITGAAVVGATGYLIGSQKRAPTPMESSALPETTGQASLPRPARAMVVAVNEPFPASPPVVPPLHPPPHGPPRYRVPAPTYGDEDGGAPALTDAGEAAPVSTATEAQLRDLVDALRAQREADDARTAELVGELHTLHEELSAAQARLDAQQEDRARRTQALSPALDHLRQADEALASGGREVDDDLQQAQGALTGPTRDNVDAARQAVASGDLFAARVYTELAMALVVTNQTSGINEPLTQP